MNITRKNAGRAKTVQDIAVKGKVNKKNKQKTLKQKTAKVVEKVKSELIQAKTLETLSIVTSLKGGKSEKLNRKSLGKNTRHVDRSEKPGVAPLTGEKKRAKREKKAAKRRQRRIKMAALLKEAKPVPDEAKVKILKKIEELEKRNVLSVSAKRHLKKLKVVAGLRERQQEGIPSGTKVVEGAKNKKAIIKEEVADSGDDDESEEVSDNEGEYMNTDDSYVVEEAIKPDKIVRKMNEHDADDNDESDEEKETDNPEDGKETDESENEEENSDDNEIEKNSTANKKASKQNRYVVFLGNLPFGIKREEILEHFNKAGKIKDVRLPIDSKTKLPKGFGYLEAENKETYEKCLSLHHTFLSGRRINVEYTKGGGKKSPKAKSEIKKKNLKLHAMRKAGKLAGSQKSSQKRSVRRAKKRQSKNSSN